MEEIIGVLNDIVWSNALIVLCLGTGFIFYKNTFFAVRHIKEMFRLLFDGKSSESGVSSFQALSMSLAGRVGTGNIAGVLQLSGGPGALFWMWMVAFLGASTAL
jgi:AGCS family alanine or glycine:cation symporter